MKLRIFFTALAFLCVFTFSQQARTAFAQSTQNVVWTSKVNATDTGNNLQKTGGCNTCADSGAVSQQTITSGDCYVEFTASETTTQRYIGLSNGNPGTTATEIAFAILLSNSVRASVQEHAVYKTEVGYAPGDIFRIAVVAGVVKYYKNGALFYTSGAGTPTYPLLVDTALVNTSSTFNNVIISSASGGVSADPELPREYINTTYPTMTGATINVASAPYNGNLQAAINSANPGDTILLTPGTTYSGNYTLPEKPNPNGLWIVIRSASTAFDSTGSIPPGTRVDGSSTSTHLAQMPKLRAQAAAAVITINPRANHYRLVGLDVGAPTTITTLINMIEPRTDSYANSASDRSDLTSYITIDRCFIHGNDNGDYRRGVVFNGNWYAVIESYISNFHDSYDSQAINGWGADGPFKISNNYLEAASENVNFGGSTPVISGLVPQDIEVSRNYFYKPTSWRDADSIPNHHVKNFFESKNSRRVLITGNIFENCWDSNFTGDGGGQAGHAILLKSTGRSVTTEPLCTWCVTEHVTITNNIVRHAGGVLVINALETGALLPVNHIKLENMLAYDIGTPSWGTGGAPNGTTYDIYNGPSDVQIIHNTSESAYEIVSTDGINSPRFTFRDNIVERQPYGIEKRGYGNLEGAQTLTSHFIPNYYRRNVIVNNSDLPTSREPNQVISDSALLAKYPGSGETFVATDWNAVGFVDRANGNYRLSSTSPYKNGASDGKDIGADQNAIEVAIAGNSPQNVVWTSKVNATDTGNNLQKTGGCNNCADSGAVSQQSIASGDCYVEFTASEITTQRYIGLSNGNPGTTATEIAFAILLSNSVRASVQEHAVYKFDVAYVPGDIFRIAVVGGVVKYSKNGVVFYTSAAGAPTYPLLVDTALVNTSSTFNNVVIKIN